MKNPNKISKKFKIFTINYIIENATNKTIMKLKMKNFFVEMKINKIHLHNKVYIICQYLQVIYYII